MICEGIHFVLFISDFVYVVLCDLLLFCEWIASFVYTAVDSNERKRPVPLIKSNGSLSVQIISNPVLCALFAHCIRWLEQSRLSMGSMCWADGRMFGRLP